MILLIGILQTEVGQNWLARQVTQRLSRELQTHLSIKHVRFHFFDKMDLEGVMLEDQRKETLLYAGTVEVRITDWFFLKDKAEIKYVGLSNAVVNFNRTDSVWNYTFLGKYFKSSDTSTKKSSGIEFDLKKMVMHNVTFVKKDAWIGNDMTARVSALDLDANKISITGQIVDIANISLTDPYFAIHDYKGNKPKTEKPKDTTSAKTAPEWAIILKNASIKNGRFKLDNGGLTPTTTAFDGKHLDFSSINGTLKNVGWAKDTINGMVNLSTRERSGLVVHSLRAHTTIHPQAMIFDNLYLKTNRSTLGNYFAMRYNDISDLDDFLHAVRLEANFTKAVVSSNDIAFFDPPVKSWNRNIAIDGHVKGSVDALSAKDLQVWVGNKTYVNGNISLIGLPNIDQTFINLEAKDLRTTYQDAVNFVPSLRKVQTPNLQKLSYLRFKGNFTGFINDFVTYGTIQTGLGTLTTDLNMKLPKTGQPAYSGTLSTSGFQVGQLLNNRELGLVDFHGKVKGRGFDWKSLDLDVDGTVHKFQYGDYTYQNIKANGKLKNRMFNGDFDIKDPNANLHVTGLVDLRGDKPIFDAKANIAFANLKALQLTREDIRVHGIFDLNVQGSGLADLLGTARISSASITQNGKEIVFDSLVVSSNYVNGLKVLRARSTEFDAAITGSFDLNELPNAFTLFLSRYYPAYIKAPRNVKPQAFTFDITTGTVEDYIQLINPALTGFNNSHIAGSLNTSTNTMTVNADVPQFSFKNNSFSSINLQGTGNFEKLTLTGKVMDAKVGDSLLFPETTFSITAQNDISNVTINTTANQAINQANLSAQVNTFSDGFSIRFNPSSFVLNGKNWTIEQGGELSFRNKRVLHGEILLKESNQEILVETVPSSLGTWNDLHVSLRNINIGDFTPLFLPKERLEGLLTGDIVIEDPENKFNVSATIRTDELRLDNDSIGQVVVNNAMYNNQSGMLTARGNNMDPDHHIDFDMAMDLKDSSNTFQDRISLRPRNFQLKILERFLGTIFSDIQGYVTGEVNIVGEGKDRQYLAKARLKDAGFKVNFTQVFYKIDDTEIELKQNLIDFNNVRIRDTLGNSAIVKGRITHHSFQDMYYDLAIQSESSRMVLLNTNYNDNQIFYGRARGAGTFVLVGPEDDLLMNIDVTASEQDSSTIVLPPSRSRESGQAGFMVEKKYGKEMNPASLRGSEGNINYNVTLTANPMVSMEVVLDELTGDVIKGRGSGVLTISSGTSAPLTINGRYLIDEGSYKFTFQSYINKPFVLRKGSNNYIEWTGDPYGATIHLDAIYKAENVSFAPLANTLFTSTIGSGNQKTAFNTHRDDVNVVATLTGQLFHPNFSFRLEFPNNNQIYNDPSVAFAIQQLEKNPNELNKQVAYLIVFNSFAPYENQQTATNPFGEAVSSTISGLLFNEVNKRLNQILSRVLQNNNFTLNLSGSLYNSNLIDPNAKGFIPNRSDVNVTLGRSLFNERLIVTVGGTFNVPIIQNNIQQTFAFLPDVTLELLLNESGSIRASFFYRQTMDYLVGNTSGMQTHRYGTSISYNKEFNSITDLLFGRKKKPVVVDTIPPALIDSASTSSH